MPDFKPPIQRGEYERARAEPAGLDLCRAYLDGLKPGELGRVRLADPDQDEDVRALLAAAARLTGRTVRLVEDSGTELVFEVVLRRSAWWQLVPVAVVLLGVLIVADYVAIAGFCWTGFPFLQSQQAELCAAWFRWHAGAPDAGGPATEPLLWGHRLVEWGRLGKLLEFFGTLTILVEIVGPARLRRFGADIYCLFGLRDALRRFVAELSAWYDLLASVFLEARAAARQQLVAVRPDRTRFVVLLALAGLVSLATWTVV